MKPLFIFLGILLAGILGYKNEPSLRYQLTGIRPGEKPGKVKPATASAQLPDLVTLNVEANLTNPTANLTITAKAGSRVKLVRVDGTNVVVSLPGERLYTGTIPISDTDLDLKAQTAANPPTDPTAAGTIPATDPTATTTTDPTATPTTDPTATPTTDPATAPATDPTAMPATDPATAPAADPAAPATPAPAADPFAVPTTDPATTPATDPAAPATDPTAVATPTPAPTPTRAPATVPAAPRATGAVGIVPIMQASIRGGQIKEFTFAQVLGWKAEPNETVDGETFQAGSVTYKAETIFGVKTLQAKAFIKNGKVQRWIWPKSGMEIK